jgi:flagellar motor switch protein FliM
MPDVLTQSQIDELLQNLTETGGETSLAKREPNGNVKDYDFRSPKKLSKEQIKTLMGIYENLQGIWPPILSASFASTAR